jgi:ATP-binding cassette subfamily C protein
MLSDLKLVLKVARLGGAWIGLAAVLAAVVVAILETVNIAMIVPIIRETTEGGHQTSFGQKIAMVLGWFGLPMSLATVLLFTLAIFTLRCAIVIGQTWLIAEGKGTIARTLRTALYRAMLHSRWQHLSSIPVSRLTNTLAKEVQLSSAVYWQGFDMLSGLMTGAFYCAMAVITLDIPPTVAIFATVVLISFLFGFRGFLTRAGRIGEKALGISNALQKNIQEHLWAAKSIKSLGIEQRAVRSLDEISRQFEHNERQSKTNKVLSRMAVEWAATATLSAMIFVALRVLSFDVAKAALLILIMYRLMPVSTHAQQALVALKGALPSCREVFALLAAAEAQAEAGHASVSSRIFGRFELAHVRFTYPGAAQPAIDDVSIQLTPGTITALVGPSGAGKSTLADIVLGLIEPDAGTIRIDGADVGSVANQAWRQGVGYVPQQAELVSGTIRDNIAWGKLEAADPEIVEAMRSVGLDALLKRLPDGIHSYIGEYGGELSGGERHRITLARALVRKPRLLVLDEPTAAIDPETEMIVWNTLKRMKTDAAVLVITHRLESLDNVDEVAVLRNGRLVDRGPWSRVRINHEAELKRLERALA